MRPAEPMNIFVLDLSPRIAARYHCDKHVVKMAVESIQMLVGVLNRYGIEHDVCTKAGNMHKGGYHNHPCTLWAGDSRDNFDWLLSLTHELVEEHERRFSTVPFARQQWYRVWRSASPHLWDMLPDVGVTPFILAMPTQYIVPGDPVTSYRNYYKGEKAYFAKWKLGPPLWWLE